MPRENREHLKRGLKELLDGLEIEIKSAIQIAKDKLGEIGEDDDLQKIGEGLKSLLHRGATKIAEMTETKKPVDPPTQTETPTAS